MDVYEAIAKRYSVRAYADEPVAEDVLRRILDAGRVAPTGRNAQQWRFLVVRDAERRKALAEHSMDWAADAPVLLAVVSTEPGRVMHCGVPAAPVDCAIAIDHMTLAAVAEGLGTCWVGHFEQESCKRILHVPDEMQIIELLTLGRPADTPTDMPRKPFDEVVRFEIFDA
jgi:nitroreductase